MARHTEQTSARPFLPDRHTLTAIRAALPSCRGCSLYQQATQVVPGKGSGKSDLMLVGEQPGSQEDLQGEPFVGPAGKLLRKACEELKIDPEKLYITNAVKHFKFVQHGARRLNQNPLMSEINACRPWLEAEMDTIRPKVILCLGASAAKSLFGSGFALMQERGKLLSTDYASHAMATIHPSAILRARGEEQRDHLYDLFRQDLGLAYRTSTRLVSKTT